MFDNLKVQLIAKTVKSYINTLLFNCQFNISKYIEIILRNSLDYLSLMDNFNSMCGIAGIIGNKIGSWGKEILHMTDSLFHRGPDDWGVVHLNPGSGNARVLRKPETIGTAKVFLGHRRLSIIDVEGTRQPLCNENGTVWTIFNGEIYNYSSVAKSLTSKGHTLKEKGDTEILPHLWEEYKESMLEHLVGMFALAIYDTGQDVLFLARDRFGQKPLFYWENGEFLSFASELQALRLLEGFPEENLNRIALAQYFRYGYIPNPGTIYKNVFSLPPGSFLLRKNSENVIKQYWKPSVLGDIPTVDINELQNLFDESVRLRLIADVPLGTFLSGGIDSSLITASMKYQMKEPVKTYTISSDSEWYDEAAAAKIIADHLKTEHTTIPVKPDFAGISQKLARHYGQPYADHSSIPTYYVSRETRRFVKVALTGDGGDELFAGYNSYTNSRIYLILGNLPSMLKKILAGIAEYALPKGSNLSTHLPDSLLSAHRISLKGENIACMFHRYWRELCFQPDFIRSLEEENNYQVDTFLRYYREAESPYPVNKWLEADQRMYLCDDILTKIDISSMSVSLECRPPFLDHHLAEYINRISLKIKLKNGETKYLLRRLAEKRLPPSIINLPKKGFSVPLGDWMKKNLKDWICSEIFDSKDAWTPYLKEEIVQRMWKEHQSDRIDHSMRLWQITAFCLWKKTEAGKYKNRFHSEDGGISPFRD